jgi:hypothetical protein
LRLGNAAININKPVGYPIILMALDKYTEALPVTRTTRNEAKKYGTWLKSVKTNF